MNSLYPYIFKRKSFHLFRNNKTREQYKEKYHLTNEELNDIYEAFKNFKPLIADIKVEIKIVDNDATNCKRGQEYCIIFYSEKKDNYLQNIGFLGEQLDLYLVSKDIGTLWYGLGRTKEKSYHDLEFVTMMAICKVPSEDFRKDMYKSKRKTKEEIWEGSNYLDIADIVRFAPSSCNIQPWLVKEVDDKLEVYRYKKFGKRGIIPYHLIVYQNLIDIGIFIYFITLLLEEKKLEYEINIFNDDEYNGAEYTHICDIIIKK